MERSAPVKFERPLRVAWLPYFPVEWIEDLPAELQGLEKMHPATWQRVLWNQFKGRPELELHILAPRSVYPRTVRFERDGTKFYCIKTPPRLRAATLYWLDTLLIRRELRRIQPDLVHGWGTEFAGAAIAGRLKYPALVTMQGILTWCAEHFDLNGQMKISAFLEPGSLKRARIATCESNFARGYLQERYPQLKVLQIEHAPNPIFSRLPRTPPLEECKIVCIGWLTRAKGADIIFGALRQLPPEMRVKLVWIGGKDAEMERSLRAESPPDFWRKVTIREHLSPEEVAGELSSATLFMHGARADNSPNSVKEAVVAGVPIIAPEIGGIPDYVLNGKNGFLFANGDVNDCREKVRQALAHPLFSRGLVDADTLGRLREYLSAETMAAKFYRAYGETLEVYDDRQAAQSPLPV